MMKILLVQTLVWAWDKSTHTPAQLRQRQQARAVRSCDWPHAAVWASQRVRWDTHQIEGTELAARSALTVDPMDAVYWDRFGFDLQQGAVFFKASAAALSRPICLLSEDWTQLRYAWRYRREDAESLFWQFEQVVVNACWCLPEQLRPLVTSEPKQVFDNLLGTDASVFNRDSAR